ncbi:Putative flippase GtrA (transmembrane translocase of bactoprenol-linked glucose) [Halogranum amylolyticum]|uniref:Putative flippase GtrA (Transmembrane translocase of bactoprenol-linked glucose) n=1 Tax=Halogranum amylolyticum TaxID=660520 RepID=A0A1H8TJ18_9EURY|nr:GtrA family protein [Halogranum amylolyticum]SEO90962.1 Putative flippase GtrA (transmembrane translocase of bactoprenol-linked glucose) [Halogranum amylolyticum]
MLRAYLRGLVSGPLAVQLRRFAIVGVVTAAIQMVLLWLLVDVGRLNYLFGAVLAIETTIILSYVFNNAWTFHNFRNSGRVEYVVGLLKTNLVRGSAIPIQLAVLFVLVEWQHVSYLFANAVAIAVSGIYRYVLDSRWTWGTA